VLSSPPNNLNGRRTRERPEQPAATHEPENRPARPQQVPGPTEHELTTHVALNAVKTDAFVAAGDESASSDGEARQVQCVVPSSSRGRVEPRRAWKSHAAIAIVTPIAVPSA
jgi:hypothetical protein